MKYKIEVIGSVCPEFLFLPSVIVKRPSVTIPVLFMKIKYIIGYVVSTEMEGKPFDEKYYQFITK